MTGRARAATFDRAGIELDIEWLERNGWCCKAIPDNYRALLAAHDALRERAEDSHRAVVALTENAEGWKDETITLRGQLAAAVAERDQNARDLEFAKKLATDLRQRQRAAEAERDALQKVATTWQEHSYNLEAKLASARAGENGP